MLQVIRSVAGRKSLHETCYRVYVLQHRFLTTEPKAAESDNHGEHLKLGPKSQATPDEALKKMMKNNQLENKLKIEKYLASNHFRFCKSKEESSLNLLKKYLPLVHSGKPLISIDCEANELNNLQLTEVGISILEEAPSFIPNIKAYHVMVKDYLHIRNYRYVPDHKDRFMGPTSWKMTLNDTTKLIQGIIDKYINEKNGILVGHDIAGDLKFLQRVGVDFPENMKTVDTMKLQQISRDAGGSLWATLKLLGIPYAYLHNAGNDAYYTLLVALALSDPVIRLEKKLDIYGVSTLRGKELKHKATNKPSFIKDVSKILKQM